MNPICDDRQSRSTTDHPAPSSTRLEGEVQGSACFIIKALYNLGGYPPVKVLDFGCGSGALVRSFRLLGLDAWGCDLEAFWEGSQDPYDRYLSVVAPESSYRLPFPDESFDSVVSTSVLEHAQNKDEVFCELHRVLTPGGQMLHIFPGKFFLPAEPHIHVPLVNWFWPYVPQFWLVLWAMAGIRNELQAALTWREVADANAEYVQRGLSYWSHRRLKHSVKRIFGNCQFPNAYYISLAPGRAARLCDKLPFKGVTAWVIGRFRHGLIYAKKL